MKYLWTTIHVNNLDESVDFYEYRIKLPLIRRFSAGPEVEIAFLGDGETTIELICDKKMKVQNKEQSISLGFKVDSLEETMEEMNGKDIFTTKIFQPNPGTRFFFIDDPNGVSIQFVEEK